MAQKITLKVEADGVKELNKQLEQAEEHAAGLKKEMEGVEEGSDSFKKLNKELEQTNSQIGLLKDATGQIGLDQTFEDALGEAVPLNTQLGELEDRMYALAAAGLQNTEGFKNLQDQVVNMRQTIIRVDESIDDLAANRGLSTFGSQIAGVGESLLTMDFERAAKQAKGLANNASQIDFSTAVKGVKNLGSTFLNLGKALLANPIMLIAAVIALIVKAVIDLMEEMGVLTAIMDAVGAVFDWIMTPIRALIQGLKDLTDWFGWTSFAAEEQAQKVADAAKKKADAQERASNRIIQDLDNEMREMEARGELSDEDFERSLEIEKEKRQQLAETAKARAVEALAAFEAAKLKGELDEKELADMKVKAQEMMAAAKQARKEIELTELENDKKRRDRKKQQDEQDEADAKERADKAKQWNANRLAAERQQEDLRLELIKNDHERELEENRVKYRRLREDTLADINLTETEKANLVDYYRQIEKAKEEEFIAAEEQRKADEKAKQDEEDKKAAEEKAKAEEEARQERLQKELEAEEAAKEQRLAIKQAELEAEAMLLEARRNLQDSALSALQGLVGENKALANTLFVIEKALAIGRIIVDTTTAIQANRAGVALAGPPLLGPGIPNPAFIAAAANATIQNNALRLGAAASIATIVGSTISKFIGGGGGGSVPNSGGGGGGGAAAAGGAAAPAPTPPSIEFFGQANTGSEGAGQQEAGLRQQPMVKAIVVESDITNTQNRLNSYQQRSEIG